MRRVPKVTSPAATPLRQAPAPSALPAAPPPWAGSCQPQLGTDALAFARSGAAQSMSRAGTDNTPPALPPPDPSSQLLSPTSSWAS
ncbi:MAG: hypothetical protein WDW38_011270 [Sanguina aurantia]